MFQAHVKRDVQKRIQIRIQIYVHMFIFANIQNVDIGLGVFHRPQNIHSCLSHTIKQSSIQTQNNDSRERQREGTRERWRGQLREAGRHKQKQSNT